MRRYLAVLTCFAMTLSMMLIGGRSAPAEAYPGAPWFEPNRVYSSNFPDPSVIVDGNRYVAYSTPTGGAMLPIMTSPDLATWTAHPRWQPNPYFPQDSFFNDGLVQPPAWALDTNDPHPWIESEVRAPGVARIGNQYVAFLTVRIEPGDPPNGRFCISVATATSALGPFRDTSSGPLVCDSDPVGSIDPEPFVDPATGTPYLLWKSEGVPGSVPQKIWIRQLSADGTSFAAGSSPTLLIATAQAWEGSVVENPSMVHFGGRYYLLYSGNEWRSAAYATGYAICAGPLGPCQRPTNEPLLDSSDRSGRLGPGGADAFVGLDGRLMIAYHYWNAPYTDYPANPNCDRAGLCASQGQRRMVVEPLSVGGDGSLRLAAVPCPAVTPAAASSTSFVSLAPARILDTRTGIGVAGAAGQGQTIDVKVAGCGGIPTGATGAVVMNVTSTEASAPSFVTVWPTGEGRPVASALNTDPGQDTPNLVVVGIGAGGNVSMFNNAGSGHLVADVVGWFPAVSSYHSLTPTRLLDTRTGNGAAAGALGQGSVISVQITGRATIPAEAGAVVLNVTSTESSIDSYVTVWPTGEGRPVASALNTDPGQDTPNLVVAKIGTGGQVSFFNNAGTGHLVADAVGWFPTTGSEVTSISPVRLLDTRDGTGGASGIVGPGGSLNLQVTGRAAIPSDAKAVILNVTSSGASAPSFVTVWPTGQVRPVASALNTDPGQDTPNLVMARVGANGQVSLFNNAGLGHLVADAVGYIR